MKKIVNFVILIVVCLLPVMVEAKATLELDEELLNFSFLYNKDDQFFYMDNLVDAMEDGSLKIFDKDYNLVGKDYMFNISAQSPQEFYRHEPFLNYLKIIGIVDKSGLLYEDDNKLYSISFKNKEVDIMDLESGETSDFPFEDSALLLKKFLGFSYDLYLKLSDEDYAIELIREYDGYYVVDYADVDNYLFYTDVYDSKFNRVLNLKRDLNSNQTIYIHDGLIYVMKTNKILDIYKLDGSKYQTFNINSDYIPNIETTHCNYISPLYLDILNDKLFIVYGESRFMCEERFDYNSVNDFVKEDSGFTNNLTLVFDLDFDVDAVSSSNGEFTYENKVDEDGKSYVELKITPNDGYSVKEIIVTDINGNRIDVTNNKFYKPMNDVRVEVKYVQGEYLPIPDTFLGKSITLILIGLILIGLGLYTVNYVKREN